MKLVKVFFVVMMVLSFYITFTPFSMASDTKTVKIGFIGPLTGPNAAFGLGARNGADLAVKQANQRSDSPYHYELVVMDDASDPINHGQSVLP